MRNPLALRIYEGSMRTEVEINYSYSYEKKSMGLYCLVHSEPLVLVQCLAGVNKYLFNK